MILRDVYMSGKHLSKTHTIHVCYISIFHYIHHKNQPNVGNTPFPWMVRENHVFVRHALHVSTVLR